MDKDILATFRDLTTLLKNMTNLLGEHAERLDQLESVVPLHRGGNLGDSAGETSDDTAESDLGDVPGFAITTELGDLLGKLLEVVTDLDNIDVAGGFSSPRHAADPTGREPHNEGEQ